AADLAFLTGDGDAKLVSTDVLELQAVRRTVDFVMRFRRGSQEYIRHLEFQGASDSEMAERCFRYSVLLLLQYRVPVLTTVIYLFPPAPGGPLEYVVEVGGAGVNRWRFEVLRLWDLDAEDVVRAAGAGVLPLIPFMRGESPALVSAAGRRIQAEAPSRKRDDLLGLLAAFASRRYS